MNAGEIQEYLIKHQVGPVTASEVAVCLRLQDKIRAAVLGEVENWLNQPCPYLHPTLQQRQHCFICMMELIAALEQGKLPGEG